MATVTTGRRAVERDSDGSLYCGGCLTDLPGEDAPCACQPEPRSFRERYAAKLAAAGLADRRTAQDAPAPAPVPQARAEVAKRAESVVETRTAGNLAASCSPEDGVRALSMLSGFHQHYDYWGEGDVAQMYADLLAAWELQTHAIEDDGSPIWRAKPRLIVAGGWGNGKSGTLDQIAMATGTSVLVKCTYPGIRDRIAKDRKVCILDDAQLTFGAGKKSEDVRLIINAHTKGRSIQDGKNGEMNVDGQVAMAGLSSLLTGKVAFAIADTLSRCFVLHKVRKPKGHTVLDVTDAAEAKIRGQAVPAMREWCSAYRPLLRQRAAWFGAGNPTGLPDLGGGGRGNDQLARPLLAVCDVATALAHQAWREAHGDGEAFPAEWNWHDRIRKALVYVSGVPAPAGDDESPLEGVSSALEEEWAAERSGEDIMAGRTER